MTDLKTSSHSDWTDCQGGEISGLIQRLQQQKAASRRTQITQSLSIAAAILVMVGVGWMMLPEGSRSGEPGYGGIVCTDVVKNGKAYVLHELEPELADRVKIHLGKCDSCQRKLTMLRERLGIGPSKIDKQQKDQAATSSATTIATLLFPQ